MATKKKTAATKKATKKSPTKRKPATSAKSTQRRWSGDVTKNSNALDLDKGVFKKSNPKQIAHSLEHSADESTRKKSDSYRSAMSMLTFYINRAGKNLPAAQKKILNQAKKILREDHAQTQGQAKKRGSMRSSR